MEAVVIFFLGPLAFAALPAAIAFGLKRRELGAVLSIAGAASVIGAFVWAMAALESLKPGDDPGPGIILIPLLPLLGAMAFALACAATFSILFPIVWLVKWYIGPPIPPRPPSS